MPKVQTSRKKFEQKVRAYKNWIYDNRNRPMREIIKELNVKLIGHYRYYGVTWNFRKITTFLHRVQQFLFKAMNRRGCRRAYTWNGFLEMLKYYPLANLKRTIVYIEANVTMRSRMRENRTYGSVRG